MCGKRIGRLTAAACAAILFATATAEAEFLQQDKLLAGDPTANGYFGGSAALGGNFAVVGTIGDNHAGRDSGAAYLFDATAGIQLFKLTAGDAQADDLFGHAVGLAGTTVLVGAPGRDEAGVDSNSGAAYLFNAITGAQGPKYLPNDPGVGASFGNSVDCDGNLAVIGAWYDNHAGWKSGSAYLFDLTTASQVTKLTAYDAAARDHFGGAVGIDGNTAVVGAFGSNKQAGAAYVFDVTTGQQQWRLTPGDLSMGDWFGGSVDVSGDVAIVGSVYDDDHGLSSGSAYLFDVNTGAELFKLTADDAAERDHFGWDVAISGDIALVGAYSSDDVGRSSGSVYFFDVNTGDQLQKITAYDASAFDYFGYSVDVDGYRALVGAWQDDDFECSSGSAYLFSQVPEPSSLVLLVMGAVGCFAYTWRKRRR